LRVINPAEKTMAYSRTPTSIIDDLNQPMNSAVNALKHDKPLTAVEFDERMKEYFSTKMWGDPTICFVTDVKYKAMCEEFGEESVIEAGFKRYDKEIPNEKA
jgi:hypothetical protein